MLSYQHGYHAGCLADVHKHASLAVVLEKMAEKDKPLTFIDTHAGRGLYDLKSKESLKTKEAEEGISALLKKKKIPADHPFIKVLREVRQDNENLYAGSSMIALKLLRKTDELHLIELHPQEFEALRYLMYPNDNVHIHRRDAMEGALALSPPKIKRGVVFIDPSFEIKTDYETIVGNIKKLHQKWSEAVIMLWYPILKEGYHQNLVSQLMDMPKFYHNKVVFKGKKEGMIGSGLIVINAPFGINERLDEIKAWF